MRERIARFLSASSIFLLYVYATVVEILLPRFYQPNPSIVQVSTSVSINHFFLLFVGVLLLFRKRWTDLVAFILATLTLFQSYLRFVADCHDRAMEAHLECFVSITSSAPQLLVFWVLSVIAVIYLGVSILIDLFRKKLI